MPKLFNDHTVLLEKWFNKSTLQPNNVQTKYASVFCYVDFQILISKIFEIAP
jgi:hypothetical protein